MAIRNESFVGETTDLTTQILKNGIAFIPDSVVKVEIYGSLTDAQNNLNIIETISTGIIHLGNGVYQYTAAALSITKTYYDKFYYIDIPLAPQKNVISSFTLNAYAAATPIDIANKAYVQGKVLNSDSTPARAVTIEITPVAANTFLKGSNVLLTSKPIKIKTNNFGEFGVFLYLTSVSGTNYDFVFKNTYLDNYNKTIGVPDGVPTIDFETA
jgi:hypothetical protein